MNREDRAHGIALRAIGSAVSRSPVSEIASRRLPALPYGNRGSGKLFSHYLARMKGIKRQQALRERTQNEPNFAQIPHIVGGLHSAKRTHLGPPTPPKIERSALLEQEPGWNPSAVMSKRDQTHGNRCKSPERNLRNEPNFAFIPVIANGRPGDRIGAAVIANLISGDHRTYLLSVVRDSSWAMAGRSHRQIPRWKLTRACARRKPRQ